MVRSSILHVLRLRQSEKFIFPYDLVIKFSFSSIECNSVPVRYENPRGWEFLVIYESSSNILCVHSQNISQVSSFQLFTTINKHATTTSEDNRWCLKQFKDNTRGPMPNKALIVFNRSCANEEVEWIHKKSDRSEAKYCRSCRKSIWTDEVYTQFASMDRYRHIKRNILESSRNIATRKTLDQF